jgi:polyribonucleotide nucleotidyltransferase
MELSDLDLVYVATETEILMIEGSALELPEEEFKAALDYAQKEAQIVIGLQKDLAAKAAKPKRNLPLYAVKPELVELAYQMVSSRIEGAIYRPSKVERYCRGRRAQGAKSPWRSRPSIPTATGFDISSAFDQVQIKAFRTAILDQKKRSDGRGATRFAPSRAKSACCPARTVPRSSPAAKPRRSAWPRWPRATRRRTSTATPAARLASASSSTITSRPSRSAKPVASAA